MAQKELTLKAAGQHSVPGPTDRPSLISCVTVPATSHRRTPLISSCLLDRQAAPSGGGGGGVGRRRWEGVRGSMGGAVGEASTDPPVQLVSGGVTFNPVLVDLPRSFQLCSLCCIEETMGRPVYCDTFLPATAVTNTVVTSTFTKEVRNEALISTVTEEVTNAVRISTFTKK